jgi:hypothetical protein
MAVRAAAGKIVARGGCRHARMLRLQPNHAACQKWPLTGWPRPRRRRSSIAPGRALLHACLLGQLPFSAAATVKKWREPDRAVSRAPRTPRFRRRGRAG